MTEEKIIERVNQWISSYKEVINDNDFNELYRQAAKEQIEFYQGLLDLNNKKQKEIENFKIKNKKIHEINYRVNKNLLELAETSISKDKIREKIKDLKNNLKSKEEQNEYFETLAKIEILEELLRW